VEGRLISGRLVHGARFEALLPLDRTGRPCRGLLQKIEATAYWPYYVVARFVAQMVYVHYYEPVWCGPFCFGALQEPLWEDLGETLGWPLWHTPCGDAVLLSEEVGVLQEDDQLRIVASRALLVDAIGPLPEDVMELAMVQRLCSRLDKEKAEPARSFLCEPYVQACQVCDMPGKAMAGLVINTEK